MSKSLPYIPFYPNDWLSHIGLRLCSPAAQGLWINLICLMWKSERRGYLYYNGKPLTMALTCALIGYEEATTKALFKELETNKVFSKEEDGTIYSRKIVRLLEARVKASEDGKKGGNPKLKTLKGRVKASLKPIVYSLDYSLDYLKFWDSYRGPNKTENAKPSCYELWKSLTDQERGLAVSVLPAYIANASEPKYIAKPSKYLTEKLWTADYEPQFADQLERYPKGD